MVKDPFTTRKAIEARLREGPLNGFEFMRIQRNLNLMAGPLRQKRSWGTLTEQERIDLGQFDDMLSQARALYVPIKGRHGGRSMGELKMAEHERKRQNRLRVRAHKRRNR